MLLELQQFGYCARTVAFSIAAFVMTIRDILLQLMNFLFLFFSDESPMLSIMISINIIDSFSLETYLRAPIIGRDKSVINHNRLIANKFMSRPSEI